jgi:hypothetical protein
MQDEPEKIRQLVYDWDMQLMMNDRNLETIEQVRQFMEGSEALEFRALSVEEKYNWIEEVLIRFKYHRLKRAEKGVIRRYIARITGFSRSQVSWLITEYKRRGRLKRILHQRHRFPRKYIPADVMLLAKTDELHGWLSGPATRKIMEREYEVYGHTEFENISRISVAHLYNLRGSNAYRGITKRFTKTKPTVSRIGERVRPDPRGQPGYIRIDTVHQGDMNGGKGVYHINAVDKVTQWKIVASVERISEAYLVPVLKTIETSSIRISTSIAPVSSLCLLLTLKARPGRLIPMRRC